MSTGKLFTCIIPDKPGTLEQRLKVRDQHISNAKDLNSKGLLVAGGGYADKHPDEGESFNFKGSIITFRAASQEDVQKLLDTDIYTTTGVWDLPNAKIYPAIEAIRKD
ncbi:uncharacterized protein SAPINGB_P000792 [Magnusiomyces paraingens]|uniref:YCII-related domain-containing protein n=1 Tax=Magnusiomyces paraingens TaxID=2606893 RepID=A0A5E8B2B7_9ASCO|nr:uncharacterized protein SAPINGB_P000792 [Saprochaete ingens]VVT45563.1 unnamed protein product [Saprochaete ingens]